MFDITAYVVFNAKRIYVFSEFQAPLSFLFYKSVIKGDFDSRQERYDVSNDSGSIHSSVLMVSVKQTVFLCMPRCEKWRRSKKGVIFLVSPI